MQLTLGLSLLSKEEKEKNAAGERCLFWESNNKAFAKTGGGKAETTKAPPLLLKAKLPLPLLMRLQNSRTKPPGLNCPVTVVGRTA
jgi:hypothetical protein